MKSNLAGIPNEEFARLQRGLDVEKWLASERAGHDLCGTMTWCRFCVKAETDPCARAKMREKLDSAMNELVDDIVERETDKPDRETASVLREEAAEEIAAADLTARTEEKPAEAAAAAPDGYAEAVRYRRTFLSRVMQNGTVQDYYTELKNALLGFAGVKARLCKSGETFRIGRERIAKFRVSGKTLSLYLALDPAEFENSKYRFEDVSDKKTYAATPMRLRITSARAARHAKELLRTLMQRREVSEVGCVYTDYHYPYRSDEELISCGLITPYRVLVRKR